MVVVMVVAVVVVIVVMHMVVVMVLVVVVATAEPVPWYPVWLVMLVGVVVAMPTAGPGSLV